MSLMNLCINLDVLINWIRIWIVELVRHQDSGSFKSRFVSCLQTQDKDVTVMTDVWYNRNILTRTKNRTYRAAVLTVLLYGSEIWTAIKNHVHRVEVFHQRCLRRIMRIKWFSNTINVIVLQRAGIENVATVISRNRLRWFGHVARNKDFIRTLAQQLLQWKPTHRKRSRDSPSKSWLDCVKEDCHVASGWNSNVEDMTIAAEDRKEWWTLARLREHVSDAGYSNDWGDHFKLQVQVSKIKIVALVSP